MVRRVARFKSLAVQQQQQKGVGLAAGAMPAMHAQLADGAMLSCYDIDARHVLLFLCHAHPIESEAFDAVRLNWRMLQQQHQRDPARVTATATMSDDAKQQLQLPTLLQQHSNKTPNKQQTKAAVSEEKGSSPSIQISVMPSTPTAAGGGAASSSSAAEDESDGSVAVNVDSVGESSTQSQQGGGSVGATMSILGHIQRILYE
jgi:hypothetical protein